MSDYSPSHQDLVLRAESWLKSNGFGVVLRDPIRSLANENPDAIGWRAGLSALIEVKVSRSDFHADKKKIFRIDPDLGMGNWRFYMCPPGLIKPEDLPEGWGLLWAHPKKVARVVGIPNSGQWFSCPFKTNRAAEQLLMFTALRRMAVRGHLPEVYEGIPRAPELESPRKTPKRPVRGAV